MKRQIRTSARGPDSSNSLQLFFHQRRFAGLRELTGTPPGIMLELAVGLTGSVLAARVQVRVLLRFGLALVSGVLWICHVDSVSFTASSILPCAESLQSQARIVTRNGDRILRPADERVAID